MFRNKMILAAVAALLFASTAMAASEYWLGIDCLPVMPSLRSHLMLSENQGLQIIGVVPGGPAAKAGIVQHDVLLRIADRPVGDLKALIAAIGSSAGRKVKIELIRGGKPRTIDVVPEQRPQSLPSPLSTEPTAGDLELVQQWMAKMGMREISPDGHYMIQSGVGTIVPKNTVAKKAMPADLSISINKSGDQPAKILVQRGNDKWDLTENDIDKLPADVRPHVEQMLHPETSDIFGGLKAMEITPKNIQNMFPNIGPNGTFTMPGMNVQFPMPVPPGMQIQQNATHGSLEEMIQRRMDEMDRRMEQLFRSVEALRAEQEGRKLPPSSKK